MIADNEKPVENRTWETTYRGELAIHAGQGTQYMTRREMQTQGVVAGAIVAVAKLAECVHIATLEDRFFRGMGYRQLSKRAVSRLYNHRFTEGIYCWVLDFVRKLPNPVPCKGKQGLWLLTSDIEEEIRRQLARTEWRQAE